MSHSSRPTSIVVTGASAGVGRAIALRLAAEGMSVGLVARDRAALEQVAAEARKRGGSGLVLPCDVSDGDAVSEAAKQAVAVHGGIDVWVNAAMVTVYGTVDQLSFDEVRRVNDVTYLGSVHGTMAALRAMRPRGRGMIVQIGSALAYRGLPLQAAYCGAKHAIRGFSAALRPELSKSGIRIVELHLPAVNTPQFDWARTHRRQAPRPAGPVYQPEAIADAVAHAIRKPAREYWLGRQGPLIILGNYLFPGLLDRKLARSGIEAQRGDMQVDPGREDNLFHSVPGPHATRGRFDAEAIDAVPSFDARLLRWGAVAAGSLVSAALGALAAGLLSG